MRRKENDVLVQVWKWVLEFIKYYFTFDEIIAVTISYKWRPFYLSSLSKYFVYSSKEKNLFRCILDWSRLHQMLSIEKKCKKGIVPNS